MSGPSVTLEHIEDCIVAERYFTAEDGVLGADPLYDGPLWSLPLLTICVLVLRNGFTVTGESACASPENFDRKIGREIAYKNAREKIWVLEGYLLKERLHREASNG